MPVIIDVIVTLTSVWLVLTYVSYREASLLAALAVVSTMAAFIALSFRRVRYLLKIEKVVASSCGGRVSYSFLRDVITCFEMGKGHFRGLCYSGQESRLYCVSAKPLGGSKDPGDFYCVRFEEGAFDPRNEGLFRGRLMFLASQQVLVGEGAAAVLKVAKERYKEGLEDCISLLKSAEAVPQ
ncbi:MAG: hypothetical protein L7G91_01750 [Acidilobus sp.]|nr:hypothetical protein [Acidilobus sp.]MCG2889429.1 hypothetical protein [Acidilobus sp.]MCG2890895.1 hypothetical protein [Acidilobus sp.]